MKTSSLLISTGVSGVVMGSAVGFLVAKKILSKQFELELDKQIKMAKEEYKTLLVKSTNPKPFATPEEAVEALIPEAGQLVKEALKTYGGHPVKPVKTVPLLDEAVEEEQSGTVIREVSNQNVFAQQPEIHIDLGNAVREPGRPYIITQEDFMQNEHEFTQITFTYYVGDHVLANERDEEMGQINQIVGHSNLETIRDLPEGINTLYVRNEKHDSDYEIVISQGKYSVEVAGLDPDD